MHYIAPLLVLANIALFHYSNAMRKRAHAKFFDYELYNLNPIWQKSVDSRRWLSIPSVTSMILLGLYFYFLPGILEAWMLRFIQGMFLGVYATLIGRYFANILLFAAVHKNPKLLEGSVKISSEFLYRDSRYKLLPVICLLFVLALMERTPFLFGALFGVCSFGLCFFIWQKIYQKRR